MTITIMRKIEETISIEGRRIRLETMDLMEMEATVIHSILMGIISLTIALKV